MREDYKQDLLQRLSEAKKYTMKDIKKQETEQKSFEEARIQAVMTKKDTLVSLESKLGLPPFEVSLCDEKRWVYLCKVTSCLPPCLVQW